MKWTLPKVKMPPGFQALQRWTNFLECNWMVILPVACIREYSYYDTLIVMTCFPILVAIAIWLSCRFAVFSTEDEAEREEIRTLSFGAFLLLLFVVFPSVSATARAQC